MSELEGRTLIAVAQAALGRGEPCWVDFEFKDGAVQIESIDFNPEEPVVSFNLKSGLRWTTAPSSVKAIRYGHER